MIKFVRSYISPPLKETRGRPACESHTGGGSTSSRNAALNRSIDVQSGFSQTLRRNGFGAAGGPCMGWCMVQQEVCDGNLFG